MSNINFKNNELAKKYKLEFNSYNDLEGDYHGLFKIIDNEDESIICKVDFIVTQTDYHTINLGNYKSNGDLINEKYGNLPDCFREEGLKYIENKIKRADFEDEIVHILTQILM